MTATNPELELAREYIHETGHNLFLTGKAGTGKTTFLHTLKDDCPKRMAVAAPTGVAAINCGGVTLHSLFQLPFGPFLPDNPQSRPHFRFSKEKRALIKSLDLLVIDEISMVRADVLDAVDDALRRLRRRPQPFGGVQLLMIGDLFQLPPVVKNEDWRHLGPHYATPYFFSSKALAETEMVTIELQTIYRQSDGEFIDILNRVRTNSSIAEVLEKLNSRVDSNAGTTAGETAITLCSHNNQADSINQARLDELTASRRSFSADIEGEFPDHTFPTEATLTLKKGAQVMFLRNDPSPEKRYYNGKIGTITSLSSESVFVSCPEDIADIEVKPSTWENIEYKLDEKTQEIKEKVIGSFNQFPLRLAWAITIHKSQGLTFDKALIDAQAAFAHGQVYVALSRCRTLEGMVLTTPLSTTAIRTDSAVLHFSEKNRQHRPDRQHLHAVKVRYQQQLLLECFDFQRLRSQLRRLVFLLLGNKNVLHIVGVDNLEQLQTDAEQQICAVGGNFQRQLAGLFDNDKPPADDPVILERLAKAAAYFSDKFATILLPLQDDLRVETDNKELKKKIRNARKYLDEEIAVKRAAVTSSTEGFSPTHYFRAISRAAVEAEKTPKAKQRENAPTYSEADIAHPELFERLKKWRSDKAESEGIAHFQVLHQKTLIQLVVNLPDSLSQLEKIRGIGPKLSERYGDELVSIIRDFRLEHGITEVTVPPPPEQAPKKSAEKAAGDTLQQTLELLEQGLTMSEIAAKRGLAKSTIESHLTRLVADGQADISLLLTSERLESLTEHITENRNSGLKELKESLPEDVSYAEIKFVRAHLERLEGS